MGKNIVRVRGETMRVGESTAKGESTVRVERDVGEVRAYEPVRRSIRHLAGRQPVDWVEVFAIS